MPTSYTNNLRLALPATGELSGVWGNTVNNSITQMIEEAITGRAVINAWAGNAYTLSEGNGVTAEARCVMLDLSGTLSGNGTVFVPDDITKLYVVRNLTSGGADVSVRRVSGGAAVSVPNGRVATVYTNGTDVIQVGAVVAPDGAMVGNVVGNVVGDLTGDVTGNLVSAAPTAPTQAFGTNNTSVATTAFVQQALRALHPVGSVYINASVNTNPATLFGFGTWVAFGSGRVPVGVNTADPLFNSVEKTGGSKDAVAVSHSHTYSGTTGGQSANHTHSGSTGSAGNHSHVIGTWHQSGGDGGGRVSSYRTRGSRVNSSTDSAGNHTHSFTTGAASGNHTHSFSGSTASAGVSGANANIQPYITVYMWKRTA